MATVPEPDYHQLQATVASLEQRVVSLESRLSFEAQSAPVVSSFESDILRITKELFPGDVSISTPGDSEYPQEPFQFANAAVADDIQKIEDRRIEWHERMRALSSSRGLLPLSLDKGGR